MTSTTAAEEAIVKAIQTLAARVVERTEDAEAILKLSEAHAWLRNPAQPHGGHVST